MQEKRQKRSQIKQNILLYIATKGISPYEFYKKSGITRGILQQNNGISEENLAKFLVYAKDVNPEWLITSKGNMLIPSSSQEMIIKGGKFNSNIINAHTTNNTEATSKEKSLLNTLLEQIQLLNVQLKEKDKQIDRLMSILEKCQK